MSTAAQINANQINAQKSTGPTSMAGKESSSQNRRTHGLGGKFTVLPTENQAEFEALLQYFDNDYKPSVASEIVLVEKMAESRWLTERALRLQNTCFDPSTGEIAGEKKFALYQRYFTTHNNAFHKAMNDLLKQRKQKHEMYIGFEREKRSREAHPFKIAIRDLEIGQRECDSDRPRGASAPIREAIADRIWAEAKQKAA